jgi:hypothetical protein
MLGLCESNVPQIELRRADRRLASSIWLSHFAGNAFSQAGEDGIIAKIFEIMPRRHNFCVEFGAWDGTYLSNTANLVRNNGWKGVFIEGNAAKYQDLTTAYHEYADTAILINSFVALSGENSLDSILQRCNAPSDFDFLSIDIDGLDYHVWQSLVSFRPMLVCIEFNPVIPNDVIFVQDPDFSINQGSSLLAIVDLAKSKGYELVATTRINAFFVPREHFHLFQIANNTVEAMFLPQMDGRIFHGYDSTVYTVGMPNLFWREGLIAPDALQVLPPHLRVFGDAQQASS